MTTGTEIPLTTDDVLVKLQTELAELSRQRTQTQQELAACVARMQVLEQRISTIQVASTTLAGLAPLAPEQEWLDHLTAWRKTLCDELLGLPPRIRDSHTLGVQENLKLSIMTIDRGVPPTMGYDLTTLRLGQLMRDAGYEPVGADPSRHYSGVMPWFGGMPQAERRIANLRKQREAAQAQLDEALLDDASRVEGDAADNVRRDARNALPQRKVRGDGSQYDRYPDGRMVEVTS